uniref:Ubiquitin-like protease family profile domain-containing protein n=1 Tax=Electrophorus electricus TaxID=8005 RepID=A0AAY5EAU2_ELEEL
MELIKKEDRDSLRTEQSVTISKVDRQPVCANRPLDECVHFTCLLPAVGIAYYFKSFPIRVVRSPSHGSSGRQCRVRTRCTAQESVREEEKEVYRQLLAVVSGRHSSFYPRWQLSSGIRSHRDFFLTSSRRLLQVPSFNLSSLPPSPHTLSTLPSPGPLSNGPEPQTWAAAVGSMPSPGALQDASSQDTQSSGGQSATFIEFSRGIVPCFQAELGSKNSSMTFRARERRRLIEEQEALASHSSGPAGVELNVRVPLEKEVPVAPVAEQSDSTAEEQEFPEMTEAMEKEVSRALRAGSQDDVLSEGFRLTITRKRLADTQQPKLAHDEGMINFYMNLLVERSKAQHLPSVYTFNTFFFPKLRSSGYSAVRRWTKKVDIFSVDIVLVPVHLGVHWCLSVVDFRKKNITYFDSMGGSNDEACRILLGFSIFHPAGDPQQMNGSDCGMFTCKYAEYIHQRQKHMPYFRRRMDIVSRKKPYRFPLSATYFNNSNMLFQSQP